ncbi:Wzz/FepE/Etk N-terminal domain-containing protein [Enterobacteriaceae bacterium H20N1]|uniref:Wzz/FepE/Etk N-terminal domain-containing protein n=1 Tax=Dryocola boscaweniae TaxID=2925397 RepID=A0A9X2W3U8_9ENTR|nr:Wzz/FepE/Etk N-terminal domain-containing protein [Dryocola boscaweniae]MCT4700545.1 Wzz/FepE/Etk N-terminal domain-containing protein [Dryocola boscaweniae]MCT4717701.1 Wzz/FepE/Etk N-terminal domain-containing protein [Dryocola boscaweniae]
MNALSHEFHNEVNLIGLLQQLWWGRYIIITAMGLSMVLAGACFVATPARWISSVIITRPEPSDVSTYLEAVKTSQGEIWSDLERQNILNSLFTDAIENIKNRTIYSKGALTVKPLTKPANDAFIVEYTAQNAQDAQGKLDKLLAEVNQNIKANSFIAARNSLHTTTIALQKKLEIKVLSLQEERSDYIKNLRYALIVATAANLHKTMPVRSTKYNETLFLLGTAVLQAMINNASSWPVPYDDSYFKIREELLQLENIYLNDRDRFTAYRYIQHASLPRRTNQNLILTMILGSLLGVMSGICIVLVRNAFCHRQNLGYPPP